MTDTLILGAVAYDPKVVTIWEGFKAWFALRDLAFDFVLYSNYESQVKAHLRGDVHIAWNSPLAWIQTERAANKLRRKATAISMRDTDQDLTSVIAVKADSDIRSIQDLEGKTVGVGAADSPQATLIPINQLANAGLVPEETFFVRRFDELLGKHGDHIGGERLAAQALIQGKVDAACVIDGNHLLFSQEGTFPSGSTRVISQTKKYDHCCFTVLENAPMAVIERFNSLLLSMSYEDPVARPLLDLEGLKQWKEGRTFGFAQLNEAVDRFGYLDDFLAGIG